LVVLLAHVTVTLSWPDGGVHAAIARSIQANGATTSVSAVPSAYLFNSAR
jgi:hypothetical protein